MKKKILIGGALCLGVNWAFAQHYYIETNNKLEAFNYYFKAMDSLVAANPKDSMYECLNCVNFMGRNTEIYSSGKLTYFGVFDFSKEDLSKWHDWYRENRKRLEEAEKRR